jgi:crotonobetainyl-CoA:carnitine CoA-transferase CaiB-like acyl-CoA transferase
MHSIRPQKLAAIGLDPQTLRTRNPRLVYAGLHGFAETAPTAGCRPTTTSSRACRAAPG